MVNDQPVLLVEDDIVDVKAVERAFKELAISSPIHVVTNGEEALTFLRNCDASSEHASRRPGLILLDLNLPKMNGLEFLREVKSDNDFKTIPVVVLTTSSLPSDRAESYGLGAAGYIMKPAEYDDFLKLIETVDQYWSACSIP
jgi:CheY-like chemotaxis protein